jgi:hypothetical protein
MSEYANTMMRWLTATFTIVDPKPPHPRPWSQLTDLNDLPIWATAKEANASAVVSDNLRDYPPAAADGRHVHDGVEYISANRFIGMILGS